mmetsp:Transcript_3647/g.9268  ORF Transcript_3647/g.9268 Transcript_3647/m.9268 type:complete len:149 (-) Transcript_3647:148-594(-)
MFHSAMLSLRRAAVAPPTRNMITQRSISMTCTQSVQRLNDILEEYRTKNYAQEFPKRFQKDVVKAASVNSRQLNVSAVSAEGIENVLHNIGMGHRMSRSEIEGIVSEVGACPIGDDGGDLCVISSDQMLDLISKNWEDHHHNLNQPRA